MENKEIYDVLFELLPDNQRAGVKDDFNLSLTSLQTIKLVAKIENVFDIELDDEYIFRGLFNDIRTLMNYVAYKTGKSKAMDWLNSIQYVIDKNI